MKVVITNVRIDFPHLDEPRRYEDKIANPLRYGATFLIEKGSENDKKINAAIAEVAKDTWGAKADAMIKKHSADKTTTFYRDGDVTKEVSDYEGHMYAIAYRPAKEKVVPVGTQLKPNEVVITDKEPPAGCMIISSDRPGVVDRAKQPIPIGADKIFAGCYVNGILDVWAQTKDNPGLRCGLNVVQYVKDGEPLSGAGSSTSADDLPDLSADLDDNDDLTG